MTTPILFELPDDPQEFIDWLEAKLCGQDLPILIAELKVVHGDPPQPSSLDQVLADRREAFLNEGLSALANEQIQKLLLQPDLLTELQELVLSAGESHWDRILQSEPLTAEDRAVWQRIESQLSTSPPITAPQTPSDFHLTARWSRLFVVAATILIAVGGWWIVQMPVSPTWGWNDPGVFTVQLTGREYLDHLAEQANEWFQQPRGTKEELEQRLQEFGHACDQLLAAEHSQLEPTDRDWLKERCRVWKGKIDGHLTDLEKGEPLEKVQSAADGTVNTLLKVLRERKVTTS